MTEDMQAREPLPSSCYERILRLSLLRHIDRRAVDEQEFRRLCDEYAACKPSITKHRLAVHESGHAIVLLHFGVMPNYLRVTTAADSVITSSIEPLITDRTLSGMIDYFAYKVAGQAAEELIFGNAHGLEDEVITPMLLAIMRELSAEERQSLLDGSEPAELQGLPNLQATVVLYYKALERAHQILESHRETLCKMASLAETSELLDSQALKAVWQNRLAEG